MKLDNAQNICIVLLLVSAAVMIGVLGAGYVYTEPAHAATASVKDGDYVMITAQYDEHTDHLYVVDIAKNRMLAYYPAPATNKMMIAASLDLRKLFGK